MSNGIGSFAPYCWDAALTMVDFFQNFTQMYPNESTLGAGHSWDSFLHSYSKIGATGQLQFDGNLDTKLNKFTIHNCNLTACNDIGDVIGDKTSANVTLYYKVVHGKADVYWPSSKTGPKNAPLDCPRTQDKLIFISNDAKIFYGVCCVITMLVSIFLIFLSYFWRNKSTIRITSWKLNIVTLIGLNIMQLC